MIIAAIIALIPWAVSFFQYVYKLIRNKNILVNNDTIREYIDTFDNEICYYVMIADSFLELLISTDTDNQKVFYYIETRFYINKSIDKLYSMIHKLDKIFDNDIDNVKNYKKVSVQRLANLLDLLYEIMSKTEIQSKILLEKGIRTLNLNPDTTYDDCFEMFVSKACEKLQIDSSRYKKNNIL